MKSLARYGVILGTICVAAAGTLAAVNAATRGRIEQQAREELQAGLKDVLAADYFKERGDGSQKYWAGYSADGAFRGIAFTANGKGYSSVIEVLVGLKPGATVSGVKILSQNETPGLGSQINEIKTDRTIQDLFTRRPATAAAAPWFPERFKGKPVAELGSVDTITGATISSRAVIDAVRQRAAEMEHFLADE